MAAQTTVKKTRAASQLVDASLYERDYHAWLSTQARSLREHRMEEIDASNLAEELADMARSARKAVKSQVVRLMANLLKWSIEKDFRERNPSAANRWLASIRNARDEIRDDLAESPSLTAYLPTIFAKAYKAAVNSAIEDIGLAESDFSAQCPWSLDDVLRDDFLPK